jgi:hypothetical protein
VDSPSDSRVDRFAGGKGRKEVWAVTFSTVDGLVYSATPSTPSTTGNGGVVTIYGGPGATGDIPGPHNDPADLYGIILVFAAIAVALVATRWLFGRGRGGPGPQ